MAGRRPDFGHKHAPDTGTASSPSNPTPNFLLAGAPIFARVCHNSPAGRVTAAPAWVAS